MVSADLGLLARRRGLHVESETSLWDAGEAGLEDYVDGMPYALICETHRTTIGLKHAGEAELQLAHLSEEWCPECRELFANPSVEWNPAVQAVHALRDGFDDEDPVQRLYGLCVPKGKCIEMMVEAGPLLSIPTGDISSSVFRCGLTHHYGYWEQVALNHGAAVESIVSFSPTRKVRTFDGKVREQDVTESDFWCPVQRIKGWKGERHEPSADPMVLQYLASRPEMTFLHTETRSASYLPRRFPGRSMLLVAEQELARWPKTLDGDSLLTDGWKIRGTSTDILRVGVRQWTYTLLWLMR